MSDMSPPRDNCPAQAYYPLERHGDVHAHGSLEQQVSNEATPTTAWTVGDLGAFYTTHRSDIHAHAVRLLKDSNRANDVVQDVFLKFVLAAPELDSNEHALAYLHRSVENQCKDIFRAEGRRPNLVVLDDATAEIEATWATTDPDVADAMEAAADAAIIRQALAMLPTTQRQALLMWEVEAAGTAEIAAALGIEEKNVRHTVSRARSNFRNILTNWVIDEERGLTALDLLSSTYKKAAANAKTAGKIALSLVILISAFLGFNSLSTADVNKSHSVLAAAISPSATPTTTPTTTSTPTTAPTTSAAATTKATTKPKPVAKPVAKPVDTGISVAHYQQMIASSQATIEATLARMAPLRWPGLDANGVPQGFTVNDGSALSGTAVINQDFPVLTLQATVVSESDLMTLAGSTNVLLDQKITFDGLGVSKYEVDPSVRIHGSWVSLRIANQNTKIETLADGTTLITAWILIDTTDKTGNSMAMPGYGTDATRRPAVITIRIHTSKTGQPIYGEAVQVLDPLKGVN
ncbi:ECF RNA polymerase sigma factor SigG [mine drainage metagenome]|uniref:ECF RNA polymerase sigma factor SigG n=1 Tax=mine drainage metagenome TaxID=410659 RepID=A0A1J5Q543_9ZZZZ